MNQNQKKYKKKEKLQLKSRIARPNYKFGGFKFRQIGIIRTPYTDDAPYQSVQDDEGDFCIEVDSQYVNGLFELIKFRYIYVIYYIHRINRALSMIVTPPWTGGVKIGVFASRSQYARIPLELALFV